MSLTDSDLGALRIGGRPIIPSEREFIAVPMQVLRRDVVKRTDNAALEEREERFGGLDVRRAPNVFARTVIDPVMTG